jgi:UDP-N-acetylmuramoyl-tripeptide--D-alanyl-D-alanine ligase
VEIAALYQLFLQYPSIQTDTRKIKAGDIFFALKGPNFNGNFFAKQALEKGAAYAIVDEPIEDATDKIILTSNALSTLQDLAKFHRQQFNIPFIAITGSNGKTTTKELVSSVLASHFTTYTTQGNLNNHIGVPLTILSIKQDVQMAVIEMGANHQKEIESYCSYTLPTHGIITNCGKAHLEGFGGEEGVKKGKGELYDFLRTNAGTAFVYWDYDYLQTMSAGLENIIKYGTTEGFISGNILESEPFLSVRIHNNHALQNIQTQLVGAYNLPNILCAVVIGKYFNIPDEKIKVAIENYTPSNSRSQLIEKGNNKIILDAYNANPTSMKAAIENFAALNVVNKVIMIGGMMELGNQSIEEHKDIITLIEKYKWKDVVLVGGDFLKIKTTYTCLSNSADAKKYFIEQGFENCYCLIKGSRSMQMEKILED